MQDLLDRDECGHEAVDMVTDCCGADERPDVEGMCSACNEWCGVEVMCAECGEGGM